jgi:hypothetical protein
MTAMMVCVGTCKFPVMSTETIFGPDAGNAVATLMAATAKSGRRTLTNRLNVPARLAGSKVIKKVVLNLPRGADGLSMAGARKCVARDPAPPVPPGFPRVLARGARLNLRLMKTSITKNNAER